MIKSLHSGRSYRTLLLLSLLCITTLVQAADPFSRRYGEKWVRISYAPNTNYAWTLMQPDDATPKLQAVDYTSEKQLWCFVGTARNFKIYNKATGAQKALGIREAAEGQSVLMNTPSRSTRWMLDTDSLQAAKNGGYRIFPVGHTAKTAAINGFGGQQDELKLFSAAVPGSRWRIVDASSTMELTFNYITTLQLRPDVGSDMAILNITCDTAKQVAGEFNIHVSLKNLNQPHIYYIPSKGTLKLDVADTYRGYAFKGWSYGTDSPTYQQTLYLSSRGRGNRPLQVKATLEPASTEGALALFTTGDKYNVPYRIPAIATAKNGDLIALADRRYCGADIGYGHVDIVGRVSKNNGATWGDDFVVLRGTGQGKSTGYGDACLVADREQNRLLLVCVAGNIPYWASKRENPQLMVRSYGTLNPKSGQWEWSAPEEFTESIYEGLFGGRINGMFMGSGRICQSSRVKVGSAYRLYAALCTHKGNYVIYSDDFGKNWKVLGDPVKSCAPKGDEPKCEELPDGSVLLSSRKAGGRYFNIYKYTDVSTGSGAWGEAVDTRTVKNGISNQGSPTDGEILLVKAQRKSDNRIVDLALQSIPIGPGRSHVGIYYKALDESTDYDTPQHFAEHWEGVYEVTSRGSAYSTMTLQPDGRIGFYFEEEPLWYQMIYLPLTIETITNGGYRLAANYRGEPFYSTTNTLSGPVK